MKNIELKQFIEELVKNKDIESFEITWNGDLGEYPGQIIKPNIKIVKCKKNK
jgi:hypothetical protein